MRHAMNLSEMEPAHFESELGRVEYFSIGGRVWITSVEVKGNDPFSLARFWKQCEKFFFDEFPEHEYIVYANIELTELFMKKLSKWRFDFASFCYRRDTNSNKELKNGVSMG